MSLITLAEAQAWAETTKFQVSLDASLLSQVGEEVLSRIGSSYDTSTWIDDLTTPRIVRVAIAKMYVAWFYDRQYSEDQVEGNSYSQRLLANAERVITGIVDGTIEIPGTPSANGGGAPSFYPNDTSSAFEPGENDDYSYGPAKFSMGKTF